jgi:aspartyl-tRNA synthetase
MNALERLVYSIWKRASELKMELKILDVSVDVSKPPFRRITYDEAVERLKERGMDIEWGEDIGTEEERELGEIMKEEGTDFYFITRYPLETKPFYTMPEGELSRSFDLGCGGIEIASGSQRIHDASLLEKRMKECNLNPREFEGYLKAFRYGMPPHGGFGMGIERVLMRLLDIENIRECILFPRDRNRLRP